MQNKVIITGTLILTLLFGSCRKEVPEVSPVEINYVASVWDESSTKATATTAANLDSKGKIRVFSYLMEGTAEGCRASLYFTDQMKYSSGAWNTNSLRYWPYSTVGASPQQSISFFAYHPADLEFGWSDGGFTAGTGNPTFRYTTPAVESQSDIIVASSLCRTYAEGGALDNNQINLSFNHIFTKIGFFAKISTSPSAPTVVLKSVKLKGVRPTSSYTFGEGWAAPEGDPVDYPALSSDLTLSSIQHNLLGSGNYMFLIPQSLTDVSLEVKYTINGGEITTKTVSLADSEAWAPGKGVTMDLSYNTGSDGSIAFTLDITPWINVSVNTTIN